MLKLQKIVFKRLKSTGSSITSNNINNSNNRKCGIVHFLPGDLTSTTSFKGEVYPLVVLDNSIAEGQRMTALMSSSGRISYSSPTFLRFWRPGFIEDGSVLGSKDRLKGRLKAFSRDMINLYEKNKNDFKGATENLMKSQGFVYEEDLYKEVFSAGQKSTEGSFAIHKFLFEGTEWIKDGQWSLNPESSGPYILRPQWQQELLSEAGNLTPLEIEMFRDKVKNVLKSPNLKFKIERPSESVLIKCLRVYCDEFYVNALIGTNPFKSIISEALLGIYIIDSQSQAKELIEKLGIEEKFDRSKPLTNSYVNNNQPCTFTIKNVTEPICNLEQVDFGQLPVYLIDPPGTVEVDDGISVEFPDTLHVHVADPSDYVSKEIENKAMRRAETVYLTEKKISMLPEIITELSTLKTKNIESGIKTLTFTCKIDLKTGNITDTKIRRGMINNLKHFTYEEAEALKDNPEIELVKKFAELHLNYRKTCGHLNLEFPRGVAKIENERISVELENNLVMKRAVAEMMIIAGRIAGMELKERKILAPFRCQDAILKEAEYLISVSSMRNIESATLVDKYKILKEMPLASVSPYPGLHSSMGLEAYVKVTSPLRRYLDLVTHKILKEGSTVYGSNWFNDNLTSIRRQEVYNKRLSTVVNRWWVERFIWQQQRTLKDPTWTLLPLERVKEGMWTVHIGEVATNFITQIRSNNHNELLGSVIKGRLISKPHESILKFEQL